VNPTRRTGLTGVPPTLLLFGSIASIQIGASVAVGLFPTIGPVATTFLRLLAAAVLLTIASRHSIDGTARQNAGWLVLFGLVMAVMNLSFYGAISRIPLGLAVAIEFVGPLGLAALTSRRPVDFAWIGLAAVGLGVLTPEIGSTLDPIGVALALVAGACWAGYVVLSPRVARSVTGNAGLALAMLAAALFALPVELVAGGLERLDGGILVAAIAVGILSTALPLSLEFEALKRVSARTYGIIMTMEPVAAAAAGAVILSQALDPKLLFAVACVTIAALGVTITDRRGLSGPSDATELRPQLPSRGAG
jgi:inner membrane transporter RhtA